MDPIKEIGNMLDWNFECAQKCYDYEAKIKDPEMKLLLHQMAHLHIKHYLEPTKRLQ